MISRRTWMLLICILTAFFVPSTARAALLVNLTGTVTDQNSAGIFGVQINFIDSCTGVTAGATGNVTSSTGSFRATVAAGVYDLEFVPPAGSLFTAHRIVNFDLSASKTLAPLALPYGVLVGGRVTDGAGFGIGGVYLHFFPPGSADRIFTAHDKTDVSGNYSVVVAPGTYDLRYGPPAGTRFVALGRAGVAIAGNTTLPTVALATGLIVSGTVLDSVGGGKPVINVNINAVDTATGADLILSHDRSDATGAYSVTVPPGTFIFDYKPEKCMLLVAQASAPALVSVDTILPQVNLALGVLVTGTVTDTRGAPVFDVNTNYFGTANAGAQVFTTGDHSDATGIYSAVVPPDTYTIEYAPPAGLRLAGVKNTLVDIRNATTLPVVQLPDGVFVTGRTVTVSGAPVFDVKFDFFPAGTTTSRVYTPHNHTDTAGNVSVVVVPGLYDIRIEPPTSALAARRLLGVDASVDRALGRLVLEQGYVVTGQVTDTFGLPVVGADLDFYDFYTGVKVETPHDNTDTGGFYSVVVPPRIYNVNAVPASIDFYETGRISGVSITANLSGLNFFLRNAFSVFGRVRDTSSVGIANVDLNFYQSGTSIRQIVSRDNTALDGTYGVLVPPGTYDVVFTPPAGSGYALGRMNGVVVQGDVNLPDLTLGAALSPSIASITPSSGPASGGTAITILGSNFQPGAAATLGGIGLLGVQVISATQINAVTPAFPAGSPPITVGLAVSNVGLGPATLPAAFTFSAPTSVINLTITRSAPNVNLSWAATGQASYTIYRGSSAASFGQAQLLAITSATSFVDVGGDADGVDYFYIVE